MDPDTRSGLHDLTGRATTLMGGIRGIGLAIAEGLPAAGARVTMASRKAAACPALLMRFDAGSCMTGQVHRRPRPRATLIQPTP